MAQGKVLLTTLDQVPRGEGRMFRVGDLQIAVFHTHADEVFATQAHCPHLNGPLADGLIGGATVVCPLHDRTFDLKTGCGISHEKLRVETYPVGLSADGRIWMSLTAEALAAA